MLLNFSASEAFAGEALVIGEKIFFILLSSVWTSNIFSVSICLSVSLSLSLSLKNTKVKVRFSNGDTDYFDIVAGVLHGDTLAPYLFIICLHYVLRTSIDMKDYGFKLAKERSRRYTAQTITDANYADGVALLANTPRPSRNIETSNKWHRPPCQCTQDGIHVL